MRHLDQDSQPWIWVRCLGLDFDFQPWVWVRRLGLNFRLRPGVRHFGLRRLKEWCCPRLRMPRRVNNMTELVVQKRGSVSHSCTCACIRACPYVLSTCSNSNHKSECRPSAPTNVEDVRSDAKRVLTSPLGEELAGGGRTLLRFNGHVHPILCSVFA